MRLLLVCVLCGFCCGLGANVLKMPGPVTLVKPLVTSGSSSRTSAGLLPHVSKAVACAPTRPRHLCRPGKL